MATKNLDEMKERLYKAFDKALDYNDSDADERIAAGVIARAIVDIEREQRAARELKPFPLDGKR